jgi:hypothetical protein
MNTERRQIKVYEIFLPHSLYKASNRVVQDATGEWFVDPMLMGLSGSSLLIIEEVTYCVIDGETFADLDWLVKNFKPYRSVFEVDITVAAEAYSRCYIELAKLVRGSDTSANFYIRGAYDVFSKH